MSPPSHLSDGFFFLSDVNSRWQVVMETQQGRKRRTLSVPMGGAETGSFNESFDGQGNREGPALGSLLHNVGDIGRELCCRVADL